MGRGQTLTAAPSGLVNVNYGTHNCVHMGTELKPETAAYEPTEISYPTEEGKMYALVRILSYLD